MQILLFTNYVKDRNSTKRPADSTGRAVDVVFKDSTTVLSPSFLIDGVALEVNYVKFNNRYYFVDNITLKNNNIYEVSCSIDVLASWKTEILKTSQYVLRSASDVDSFISDVLYPTTTKTTITTNALDTPFFASTPRWYIIGVTAGTVQVRQTGELINTGSLVYYAMRNDSLSSLIYYLMNSFSDYTQISDLSEQLGKSLINPLQYIKFVRGLPYEINTSNLIRVAYNSVIPMGTWNINVGDREVYALPVGGMITSASVNINLDSHPQVSRGAYMNCAPYTERYIKFYPFGVIPIDTSKLGSDATSVNLLVSMCINDGKARLYIRNSAGQVIDTIENNVEIDIPLTQLTQDITGGAKSAMNTASGAISNVLQGDVMGAIAGTASGILDYNKAMTPQGAQLGGVPSYLDFSGDNRNVVVRNYFHSVVSDDVAHRGRPLCKVRTLSALSGYTLCADSHISFPCLTAETDMIENYLNNGFYIE